MLKKNIRMSYSGTSISDMLNGVIESLDKKTETKVRAEYGEDIASKVEHISKQIENLPEGGSGGSGSGDERLSILVTAKMFAGEMTYGIAPDYDTITDYLNTHSNPYEGKFPAIDVFIDDGNLHQSSMAQVGNGYDEDSNKQMIVIDAVSHFDVSYALNGSVNSYGHQILKIGLKSDDSIKVFGNNYISLDNN